MIKYERATIETIKRFDKKIYQIQALQAMDKEVKRAAGIGFDTAFMATILAGIELGYWGTGKNSTRIDALVSKVQEIVDTSAEYYDNAIAEGLKNKLHEYSIEYMLR